MVAGASGTSGLLLRGRRTGAALLAFQIGALCKFADARMVHPCIFCLMGYIELQVTSNFSFLRGASHLEYLIGQASALGYPASAITDRNSFAGMVRAHIAARKKNIRLIPGCPLDLM